VVLVDEPRSRYPYSGDGLIAVPASADWLDSLLALSFAAARAQQLAAQWGVIPGMSPRRASPKHPRPAARQLARKWHAVAETHRECSL
jgi:hypothetical protein